MFYGFIIASNDYYRTSKSRTSMFANLNRHNLLWISPACIIAYHDSVGRLTAVLRFAVVCILGRSARNKLLNNAHMFYGVPGPAVPKRRA